MLPEHDLTSDLAATLARLTEEVGREHERAAHREQIIDRLHAENQELRHGLLQEALAPVRNGLYRLHDTVTREAARLEPGHSRALLEAIAEEVAEVLARTGADRIEVAEGDAYDPAIHRPAGTAEGAPNTVVGVVSEGFRSGERVLRKAGVVIGKEEID
ncbi:nucleotide exchange factor GrpE [Herbidospora galbida]|uniref:Nucleotide exchange factor GrpE n=1 Tax=Herbidospora galbida TaxID=2575442 RepID=A0A4U3LXG4_9ACTN|nr:nucleotide exchange factor GrpE [Herbidospora galbida]TKK80630.1 nucleotide exchange factor GrpE [Herbidospora galbida]